MSPFISVPETEWLAANDLAFAIYDRYPVNRGHALVITRRQIPTWWDATPEEQQAIFQLVEVVKRLLDEQFQPAGYNVGFNAGEVAGQTVPHLHVHVIPRYVGDMDDPTGGVRHVIPWKGNYKATETWPPDPPSAASAAAAAPSLVLPRNNRLHSALTTCLANPAYDRIDLVISFVMWSGVELMKDHLQAAVDRGVHLRLLTSDYLLTTDVNALGFFLDRIGTHPSGATVETKVFSNPPFSFHPKAYLFSSSTGEPGVAFVGSSNFSRFGIQQGIEWNLETEHLGELLTEFEVLWNDTHSVELTSDWLSDYKKRKDALASHMAEPPPDEVPEPEIKPWSVQQEALAALEATRIEGHSAGLVVMATGLGKTWLAAFDTNRPRFRRVLFVAHREEILSTSRDVYRRIRPGGRLTMYLGDDKDPTGDVVFASVQSLERNLDRFQPDAFDYIVVDEFHHAAAPTYRRVIGHFRPRFLLGLTATPDRTDAADLLALCDDNLVYECGLARGLERELLSPFRYRAIKDVADYEHIPWRAGRFVLEDLSKQLETQQRAQQVFDEWSLLGGADRRTLGFCCTTAHADFMAEFFRDRGVRAVAVHSGPTSSPRLPALDALAERNVDILFSVDLFNEGIDVPAVDIVMMLRPTESPIVFFQQLGRGLRRSEGKTHLDVVDLVGNHRSFLMKARLLAGLLGKAHVTDREAVGALRQPADSLPDGCSIIVDAEAIDLLEQMLGAPKAEDRLAGLARAWADDHDGVRPRALELALVTRKSHELKKLGGWFGFLDGIGMLGDVERAVLALDGGRGRDFLLEIEHGAYTKSFKLVTLRAMLNLGTLRSGSSVREVALNSRWQIFKDPKLLGDLSDAGKSFDDVMHPTETEWDAYWTKNPIAAWTGANTKASAPWFSVANGEMALGLDVPDELGLTFDAMVAELVEYRLHRYVMSKSARLEGQRLRPLKADGSPLDAQFVVQQSLGQPLSVVFESAGGVKNADYRFGIDAVLELLSELGALLVDAYVDSAETRHMPLSDRRLATDDIAYPLALSEIENVVDLRVKLQRSSARLGRGVVKAKSGGNREKQIRLILGNLDGYDAVSLGIALATVPSSVTESAHRGAVRA